MKNIDPLAQTNKIESFCIITERDEIVLKKIAKRGWVSSEYLTQFFPTRQAMTCRLNILKKNFVLESKCARDVLKEADFNLLSFDYSKFFSINSYFYKISDMWYRKVHISTDKFNGKRMITHQVFQEYVEMYFLKEFKIKNIESNPDLKPTPDLYFIYNNKKITVEIERTIKRNPNNLVVKRTRKDGSIKEYTRKAFSY